MKSNNYILLLILVNCYTTTVVSWKVVVERYNVTYYDKTIVNGNISVNWFNRTTQIANTQGELYQDLSADAYVLIKIYGQYSNKYTELPINYNRKICDIYHHEYKWLEADLKGVWPKSCPIKKGKYYIKDYVPNVSRFPSLPWNANFYKIDGKVFVNNKLAGLGHLWLRTTREDEYAVKS